MLLRNLDVYKKQLANGTCLRIVAEKAWSDCDNGKYVGKQDINTGKWKAPEIDLQTNADFTVFAVKEADMKKARDADTTADRQPCSPAALQPGSQTDR